MRHMLIALAASAALFTASSPVRAAEEIYARIGYGNSKPSDQSLEDDASGSVGVGWRFLSFLAVELGYNDFGESQSAAPSAGGPLTVSTDSVELGLSAKIPFGKSDVSALARAGVHRWDLGMENTEISSSISGTDPFYGLGIGYDLNDKLGLNLTYDRYRFEDSDADRIMLSVEIR